MRIIITFILLTCISLTLSLSAQKKETQLDLDDKKIPINLKFRIKATKIINHYLHGLKQKESTINLEKNIKARWLESGLDKDWIQKSKINVEKLEFGKNGLVEFRYKVYCPGPDGLFRTHDDINWERYSGLGRDDNNKRKIDKNKTTLTFLENNVLYNYSFGFNKSKLAYLVIQHAPLGKTISGAVISFKCGKAKDPKRMWLITKNESFILPDKRHQVFEYINEKLIRSNIHISKEEVNEFLSSNGSDFSLNALEKFLKGKKERR